MEQSRAYSKAAGKKWFRFFRTGPLPIGTESYRQILPPLNFIRLSSGLHDNKYPRGVFETAERITKLREKTFSRSDLILQRAAFKLNYKEIGHAAFLGSLFMFPQTPLHNKPFTHSICCTRENCSDVQ